MGLRDRVKKLSATTGEMEHDRLLDKFSDLGIAPIAECGTRLPARICGEVLAMQVVPRAGSPWLEITVSDGSAKAVAIFTGRTRIAGLEMGRGIVLEGVPGVEDGRRQLLNPAYTLL